MTIATLENLLKDRIGLDPEVAGRLFLKRAVNRRLKALGRPADDFERYEDYVTTTDGELRALIEEVVVAESWFFRDDRPFEFLREVVAERWLAQPHRAPLQILSIPCSRGEEPYSIAMTLDMAGLPRERFRIEGADISRHAIDQAKEGLYPANAFRSKNLAFRDHYFASDKESFRLAAEIRSPVHFRESNLLDDPPSEPRYDIIFCRNLLIYFDRKARARAVAHLIAQLEPKGILFLGHAEGLGLLGGEFRSVGGAGTFAFEWVGGATAKSSSGHASCVMKPEAGVKSLLPATPKIAVGIPSAVPKTEANPPAHLEYSLTLEDAKALADQGRNEEAAKLCDLLIARNGPSAEGFYLLGLVRQAIGDRGDAERCFEKAVYLDGRHEEALLALARISEGRGDAKTAELLRRRAGRSRQETES